MLLVLFAEAVGHLRLISLGYITHLSSNRLIPVPVLARFLIYFFPALELGVLPP